MEIKELKAQIREVTAMKSDIEQLKRQFNDGGDQNSGGRSYRRKQGCPTCIRENLRCRHCFLCGSADHFKSNCDKKSEN